MPQRATLKLDTGKIRKKQRAAAARGLRKAAEHVLQVSREIVPHEEGTLERSGTVSVDEGDLRAAISYDGPYAVIQHERLNFRHDEGRQAKYLEQPMSTERGVVGEIVAAEIRRSLK